MADLAATDVTVVVNKRPSIMGRKKICDVTISYGNASLLYPVGGIPLPAISKFGLGRNLDELILSDKGAAAGFAPDYDKTNHKLKLFAETTVGTNQPLIEATNGLAPAATVIKGTCVGW